MNKLDNNKIIQEAIDLESQWFEDIDIEAYFLKINKLLEIATKKFRVVFKLKFKGTQEKEIDHDFDSEFEATKFLKKYRKDPFYKKNISYSFVREKL